MAGILPGLRRFLWGSYIYIHTRAWGPYPLGALEFILKL